MRPWREVADPLAGASIGLVIMTWVYYVWERSTGFTFAMRRLPSRPSTPAHLAHTLSYAIGITALFLPVALLYFTVLRKKP